MHRWGDDGVDWVGIDGAAEYIGQGLRFWRVDVRQWKEKYGAVRVYCSLGIVWWPQLTHPGHVYNRWPRSLDFIVHAYSWWNPFYVARRAVNLLVVPFHKWLYRRYYRRAVEKWSHLRREILCCADYPELLEGI